MELSELKNKICKCFTGSSREIQKILQIINQDKSVFPFNEFEYLICHLIEIDELTFQQYLDIRAEYISQNTNLWIFEISAPRRFGEGFAQTYLHGKCTSLKNPSKKLDPEYSGQYDLWLNEIKIEVKASRAVDSGSSYPLYMKALSRNTKKSFLMNFQQLKPQCCDVFIWLAIFRDEIVIWVINSNEVKTNPLFSLGQHRGNHGNEGQLHITHKNIRILDKHELKDNDLGQFIKDAAKRKTV